VLGRTEDGAAWLLPLGLSTLTAGSSGSGKASLIWGLVFALGPAVRCGLLQLHGIDLKGGMELSMGRPMFTCYAQTSDQAVALLEDAATQLQARAARLAGQTRQHQPSLDEPLVVVVVDELAALIAYQPDRDLTRRAESARPGGRVSGVRVPPGPAQGDREDAAPVHPGRRPPAAGPGRGRHGAG
jgi:S-DNA-T family DNA segregation ATPase FtsK/SpoIIIE